MHEAGHCAKALLEPSKVCCGKRFFSGLFFRTGGVYLLKSDLPKYLAATVSNSLEYNFYFSPIIEIELPFVGGACVGSSCYCKITMASRKRKLKGMLYDTIIFPQRQYNITLISRIIGKITLTDDGDFLALACHAGIEACRLNRPSSILRTRS